jgi:hypothetical protein
MCFENAPIIHAYTREHAFADGVLVNLSTSKEWKEAGFKFPVACTRAVWEKYIEWTEADVKRQIYQDTTGRLWDVLYMLSLAIRVRKARGDDASPFRYQLYVVPRGGRGMMPRKTVLKVMVGPGDYAEPVLTIMLPNED